MIPELDVDSKEATGEYDSKSSQAADASVDDGVDRLKLMYLVRAVSWSRASCVISATSQTDDEEHGQVVSVNE